MTHSATLLTLDALCVARLTRLIVADAITAPLRQRLAGTRPATSMTLGGERLSVVARPRLSAFIACPWCVSPYLAALVVILQALAPGACLILSAIAAFSLAAGVISEHS